MCGIAGVLDSRAETRRGDLDAMAGAMAGAVAHRGPDDHGVWVDPGAGVALAHRRLSIIDLSPEGRQPMASACGRYVVTFNGEIYNFVELREQLSTAGHRFRGHSDTEVLLAACSEWGLPGALQRANGMFALALWDHTERTLTLARDRLGEKPLYYGWAGRYFVFGSELKALRACRAFSPRVDHDSLTLYLRHGFVPAPRTIYEEIATLEPGTAVTVSTQLPGRLPEAKAFWSLAEAAQRGTADPFEGSDLEAADELDSLLQDAVRIRTRSDVPLGAFLSGGLDSSTIVAVMQAAADRPVHTFTVAFDESSHDESADARRIAQHLGVEHTEIAMSADRAIELVPRLPEIYDEPFADPSELPTLLVTEAARRHVTVCLSGDGGDELFGGYNRHVFGPAAWKRVAWMPGPARRAGAAALRAASPARWDRGMHLIRPFVHQWLRVRNPGDKAHKLADVLGAEDADDVFRVLMSQWQDPEKVVRAGHEPTTLLTDRRRWPAGLDPTQRMLFLDAAVTLPDDMLVKIDRASMAVALEVRVPLLDPRIVEFAWRLPLHMKIRGGRGKWLLRQVLARYLPLDLVDRPKMGFDPPIGEWLRGPLRSWAEDLLAERRIRDEGYFEPAPIRAAWKTHLEGRSNLEYPLWAVLNFQAWVEANS